MEYQPFFRFCIAPNEPKTPLAAQIRSGYFIADARMKGVTAATFQTLDPVTGKLRDSLASFLWTYIEDHYTEFKTAPSVSEIQTDIDTQHATRAIDEATATAYLHLVASISARPVESSTYAWAYKKIEEGAQRTQINTLILQATALAASDPVAAYQAIKSAQLPSMGTNVLSMRDLGEQRWQDYRRFRLEGPPTTPTGIQQFDERVGGLWPGDLGIVAARTSIGKSFFMCLIAKNLFQMGKKVLLFSGEMGYGQYLSRIEGLMMGQDPKYIRMGDLPDKNTELRYRDLLRGWTLDRQQTGDILLVDRTQGLRVSQLGDVIKQQQDALQANIDMLLVDPFYHVKPNRITPYRADWEEKKALAEDMKALMFDLGIPGLAAHQITRGDSYSTSDMGTERLKGSDSIGDEIDWLFIIGREVNNPNTWLVEIPKARGAENSSSGWKITLHTDLKRGMICEPEIPAGSKRSPRKTRRDDDVPASLFDDDEFGMPIQEDEWE